MEEAGGLETPKIEPEEGACSFQTSGVEDKMLTRLSQCDAHFKHQQRNEPDLTDRDKYDIAKEVLHKNASLFLDRFGKYLELEDLEYFNDRSTEYEIQFYLNQIRKEHSKNFNENRVKNRRYEAMKKLVCEGDYFSEEEMKYRDPYLYEQLIGQYLDDDEVSHKVDKSDLRFSTILLKHMDQLDENQLYACQKDKEEGQMEEEEDSEEEEEMEDDVENQISESKKAELRQEFYTIMQERFMSGQDQYDYSQVDSNADFDDLDVLDKDEEEKYFDSEEPEELSAPDITVRIGSMDIESVCDPETKSHVKQDPEYDAAKALSTDTKLLSTLSNVEGSDFSSDKKMSVFLDT